jgi:hypothetical protein
MNMDGMGRLLQEIGVQVDPEEALKPFGLGLVLGVAKAKADQQLGIRLKVEAGCQAIMAFEGKPIPGFGRGLNFAQCSAIAKFFGDNLGKLSPEPKD